MKPKKIIKNVFIYLASLGGWFVIAVLVIREVHKFVGNSNTDNPAVLGGGVLLILLTYAALLFSNIKLGEFISQKLKEKPNG